MKTLLAATIAFALVGGAAFAEITVSGDAKLGIEYNSPPTDENGRRVTKSKRMLTREIGVDFIGSGTTDGGLSFGGKVGFDTIDGVNTGTAYVSGAFGTVTYGHDDAADALAGGIADVGLNGLGVDDVVEDIRGNTATQARYDLSVGNFAFAISAATGPGTPGKPNPFMIVGGVNQIVEGGSLEVKKNSYAVGMSLSASGVTVGLGYDSKKTTSAGLGFSTGPVSANAFYAERDQPYMHLGSNRVVGGADGRTDGTFEAHYSGHGFDLSYTMGASTLTMVYAETELTNIQPDILLFVRYFTSAKFKGTGVGFSHDLGGGAKLVAGFGKIPQRVVGKLGIVEIGQVVASSRREDLSGDKNVASMGLSFSF